MKLADGLEVYLKPFGLGGEGVRLKEYGIPAGTKGRHASCEIRVADNSSTRVTVALFFDDHFDLHGAEALEVAIMFGEGQDLHGIHDPDYNIIQSSHVHGQLGRICFLTGGRGGDESCDHSLTLKAYGDTVLPYFAERAKTVAGIASFRKKSSGVPAQGALTVVVTRGNVKWEDGPHSPYGQTDPAEDRMFLPNTFKPLPGDNGNPYVFDFFPSPGLAEESGPFNSQVDIDTNFGTRVEATKQRREKMTAEWSAKKQAEEEATNERTHTPSKRATTPVVHTRLAGETPIAQQRLCDCFASHLGGSPSPAQKKQKPYPIRSSVSALEVATHPNESEPGEPLERLCGKCHGLRFRSKRSKDLWLQQQKEQADQTPQREHADSPVSLDVDRTLHDTTGRRNVRCAVTDENHRFAHSAASAGYPDLAEDDEETVSPKTGSHRTDFGNNSAGSEMSYEDPEYDLGVHQTGKRNGTARATSQRNGVVQVSEPDTATRTVPATKRVASVELTHASQKRQRVSSAELGPEALQRQLERAQVDEEIFTKIQQCKENAFEYAGTRRERDSISKELLEAREARLKAVRKCRALERDIEGLSCLQEGPEGADLHVKLMKRDLAIVVVNEQLLEIQETQLRLHKDEAVTAAEKFATTDAWLKAGIERLQEKKKRMDLEDAIGRS